MNSLRKRRGARCPRVSKFAPRAVSKLCSPTVRGAVGMPFACGGNCAVERALVRLIDLYAACANPSDGYWKAGYNITGDTVHAEETGARAMGKAVAAALADQVSLVPTLAAQNNSIMWSNSLFLNDNGSGFPSGAGWGNYLTGATSQLVSGDANVIGNRMEITVASGTPFVRPPPFASAAGNYIAVMARVKAVVAGASPSWRTSLVKSVSDGTPLVGFGSTIDSDGWLDFYSVAQLPVGFGSPCLEFGAAGAGTVLNVAQIGIFDLTAAGLSVA